MAQFEPNITKVKASGSIQTRLKAALSLAGEGRLDEALRESEAVLKIDANSKHAHMAAGRINFKQKRFDDARRHFEEAIRIDPLKPRAYLRAARVCLIQNDLDRAMSHTKDAIRLNAKSYVAYLLAGQVRFKEKDYQGAQEFFQKAASLNPRSVTVRHQLAQTASQNGDFEGAAAILTEALRIDPDHAETYERLGRIQLLRNDSGAARQAYEKALELNPELDTNARLGLAEASLADSQIELAVQALTDIPQRGTAKARFHKLWGDVHHARGQYPTAVEEYMAAELMLTEQEAGAELKFDKTPTLAPTDPKWKGVSEKHRKKAGELVEARRLRKQEQGSQSEVDDELDGDGE